MRLSQYFWTTLKEDSSEAEIASHRLSIRAGLIQKTSLGIYSLLPMGLRVIFKIEKIIREEMSAIFCHEVQLPIITPSNLWEESGRWEEYGPELLRFKDRHERQMCFSPTNEESIVDLFRKSVKSYKQLPLATYQIQTKFRDEVRPRFGLMRAREFLMKDAYSFHLDSEDLERGYWEFHKAYQNIFARLGLDSLAVEADAGAMARAGAKTHEFQILADTGEDVLVFFPDTQKAANLELAATIRPETTGFELDEFKEVSTPNQKTIEEVSQFLDRPASNLLKACLFVVTDFNGDKRNVMFLSLGDDRLSEAKLRQAAAASQLEPSSEKDIKSLGLVAGYLGPMNLEPSIELIFDHSIKSNQTYVVGANKQDTHFKGFLPERDCSHAIFADIRLAREGDLVPGTQTPVVFRRGIEVGHIFQLGQRYTKGLKASVLGKDGRPSFPFMGCYGIGIGRIMAAAIEQNHDEAGICWPQALAPFQVYFAFIRKSSELDELSERIYSDLSQNFEVLFDDRKTGAGSMLKDADLLGLPIRVVLGERDFKESGKIEVSTRKGNEKRLCSIEELGETITELLAL